MTNRDESEQPLSVVKVTKLAVVPTTSQGLSSFAQVDVEFVRDSGIEQRTESVSLSLDFNVDGLTLDQIKDFAILHAKALMNRCVTDPHLKVGDVRFRD